MTHPDPYLVLYLLMLTPCLAHSWFFWRAKDSCKFFDTSHQKMQCISLPLNLDWAVNALSVVEVMFCQLQN
jgi:hypothetical protein